jgi:hypothetical protein
MKGKSSVGLVVLICLMVIPVIALGAQKFGVIFDVKGNASIKSSTGKVTELKKSRHILRAVNVGDTIQVNGAGKVLIVSLKDKKGYAVLSDTIAKAEQTKLAKLSGTINVKEGYNVPTGNVEGPLGATVLRNTLRELCIKALSPLNTAVLSLTPTLKWKNSCEGSKEVSIKVIKGRSIIFETMTDKTMEVIPSGILEQGQTYRWLIDGGPANGIMGGTFSILDKETAAMILTKKAEFDKNSNLPKRLNYLFMLMQENLLELADAEITRLKSDFPNNKYIQELK